MSFLLINAGDIELNPGPGTSQNDTGYVDDSLISSYFSVVNYNIQSIFNKVDLIGSEFRTFNIICPTESWLGPNTTDEALRIDDYRLYRRDRPTDNHGGVCVYIKEDIYSRRRSDLELPHVECVWVEINIQHKKILIGIFYRPPNSSAQILSYIEDSINLAFDCNINDIFVTGDFNLDTLKHASKQKVCDICQHFTFDQLMLEPTHFAKSSSSIIDLILTSNKSIILLRGVGDPFLDQSVRYHCPLYFVLSYHKVPTPVSTRHIWLYDRGDYQSYARDLHETNWELLKYNDIDAYAKIHYRSNHCTSKTAYSKQNN